MDKELLKAQLFITASNAVLRRTAENKLEDKELSREIKRTYKLLLDTAKNKNLL